MEDIIAPSPDLLHKAVLKYVGEICFGPAYYSLTLDQISFGERVFGNAYLWSPNSQYLALQEWETTSEIHGPQTRLLLIDLQLKNDVCSQAPNRVLSFRRNLKRKNSFIQKSIIDRARSRNLKLSSYY